MPFLLVFLSGLFAQSGAPVPAATHSEYLNLTPEHEHHFKRNKIYVLSMTGAQYEKPILFEDSEVFNWTARRVRRIRNFTAKNTAFHFARLPGVLFENCVLENVRFVRSELSFVRFRNCRLSNVAYEKSVTYGLE